ncbi:hypothetical protein MKW94_018322 [Papaver nudicaule]|uniref:Clp R domain-containing protein n=1 Tax=Papaver nudicaule TaxID=74823 RepID=A0AA41SCD0_PAPNU|nr:hypothetical protein [Papaver nudicaule]
MAGTLLQSRIIGASLYGTTHDSKQGISGVANRRTVQNSVQMRGLRISAPPSLVFSAGTDFHSKAAISLSAAPNGRGSRCVAIAGLFARFTERAIKVIMVSQEEARRMGHSYVGTEQLLLGLISDEAGIPAKVLKSMGINLRNARAEVEKIIGRGEGILTVEIPFTPGAKRGLELAQQEAPKLGHYYIGYVHLLLGILQVIRMVNSVSTEPAVGNGVRGDKIISALKEYGTILTKLAEEGKLEANLVNLEPVMQGVEPFLKGFIRAPDEAKMAEEGKSDPVYRWVRQIEREMKTSVECHIKVIMRAQEEARRMGHNSQSCVH